jgi:hypothetical protein
MKLILVLVLIMSLGVSGCAYEKAYISYAESQATMAKAAGPLFKQSLTPDGRVASFEVGNPLTAMAMMQMKAPKSEWESLVEWMKMATPFAAIWGIVGSIGGGTHNSTSVSGTGNFVGNQAGNQSQWASPTTTTTTTEVVPGVE